MILRWVSAWLLLLSAPAWAAIHVTVSGPAGSASQTLPDAGGAFDVNLPLSANALNEITVTATDSRTNTISKKISIAQISLQSIVVASIRTEPLTVQQIEQLVNDGVIQLDNPANFNVSQFAIVLTIGGQEIPIEFPLVMPLLDETGGENIPPLRDPGRGSNNTPNPPDITIIQEIVNLGVPGQDPIPIPAILVIEGRIKSLKEFFSVRLLLMNVSGIFTLSDVLAQITFPDGGLSATLPADGLADFGNVLPGDGDVPGQKEREFIIRGDEIGTRRVRVDFGGVVRGPGIPDDAPVPFNGSADSTVEVKGPPNFLVEVTHPDFVSAGVPYELEVKITNAGQAPALYTTFDLGVGFAGEIVECELNPVTTNTVCTNTPGPVTRKLGHIFPGQTVSQKFTINPLATGPISSCLGISDQNINLQVNVGVIGCLTGRFPPTRGVPAGIPTVAVVPANNQLGVSVTAPVAAFFSENMKTSTINSATFKIFTGLDEEVPGQLLFQSVLGRTVAIWQPLSGVLQDNTIYRVLLTQAITDPDNNPLFNEWSSTFRTTSSVIDTDPPELSLTILPPVDPNYVLPGQIIPIRAYAADQGSGIAHIELYARDLNVSTGLFEHIDDKTIFSGADLPITFSVDSSKLTPGHTYLFRGSAFDRRGNVQDATIAAVIAPSADPPVIVLPPDPTNDVLYGVSVSIAPVALTGGVRTVDYFLDGSTNAFATMFVPPFQTSLNTFPLALTSHTIRAVATDGLGQTGEDFFSFNLVTNASEPVVDILSPIPGARFLTNELIGVSGFATDAVGIASVRFYIDDVNTPPIATNTQPFAIAATNLAPGPHEIIMLATNVLGKANDTAAPASRRAFSIVSAPPGPPPPAPVVTNLTDPDSGTTLVSGTSVSNARVTIVNANLGLSLTVDANPAGAFIGEIAANGGHTLRLTAQNLAVSPDSSATTTVVVPVPPNVTNLVVTPASRLFTAAGQIQDFVVTAQLAGGGTSNVTARSSFSSSAPGVASVNQAGRMVAQGNGAATLTTTFKTNTVTAAITVDIVVLTNFTVHISNPLLVFTGQTAQITVTGQYSNGSSAPLASGLSFGATDPSVATVNGSGLVTAVGEGNTTITVGAGGLPPKSVSVSVAFGLNPPPSTTILSPANGTLVERGQLVTVNVQAVDPTGGIVRTEFRTTGAFVSSNSATYSVRPTDTRGFNFNVPAGAPIGGVITAAAWSVDVAGLVSPTAQINLVVADLTAPLVSILTPTNGQPFNDGFTVTVTIASSDAIGVGRVRYETSGALALSGAQTNAFPLSATNVFQFIIPPGAPSPDLYITAYARDAAGNERTSTPVQVELTGADITPPATIVTAASAPGSSASNVLSYTVTSGLADLKYVQIYFRRNGIGTFNLYTETSGTNILGRFYPQSGTNGTVVFDSTQMGGDGAYEFYSVGVDQIGNRELPPTNADQTATFNAGTVWIDITASTNISASNFAFDNANLRISNAVVTIEGAHTFRNVEILGTGMITHAEATATNEPVFNLTLWTLSMTSNATINVSGRGYLGGQQPGNPVNEGRTTNNALGATARSAGSHGGLGGAFGGTPNPLYGNLVQPTDLGSGGSSRGDSAFPGGDGGGRIRLNAINVAADGSMRADGFPGLGFQAGSGSGGSVFILTRSLSGLGLITADGGAFEVGGGGGRIGIHYTDMSTKNPALIRAIGGDGSHADGGNGTVFLKGPEEADGTLIVDGQGIASPFSGLPIPVGVTFDNIIIRNDARVIVDDPIVVRNALEIRSGSILTHSIGQTNGLQIVCKTLLVDGTSLIDVSGKGYRGGFRDGNAQNPGETLGGQTGAQVRAGGSYGGLGGIFDGPGGNLVYGTPYDPIYLGAGGSSRGDSAVAGGNGGGRVGIVASNSVTIHGAIRADGQNGNGFQAGSGAGGSIKIQTSLFQGTGAVSANGGVNEVGGGGGRIAILYNFTGAGSNDFNGLRNLTASGGKGANRHGSAGTVLMRHFSQPYGDLYLDATTTNATAQLWSPLTPIGLGRVAALTSNTLTLDGAIAVLPGGLVGLRLKPNVNHAAEFTIVGNTASSITVSISGGTNLTDVAAPGDIYAALYRFDNVILRRGAWLVSSDRIAVNGSLQVTEHSVVTHFNTTTNFEPALDIFADAIAVQSNSQINVNGRGYLGGQQPGNPVNSGRTTNNALGAAARSGGSHGGRGAFFDGAGSNPIHGDVKTPTDLGSGGSSRGDSAVAGGNGGGRILLTANTLTVDGLVTADGNTGNGFQSGSGSGGSILLHVGTLAGSGIVRANGAAGEVGGGGGRVAVYYTAMTFAQSNMQARGADASNVDSGHGTIFLKSAAQSQGDLIVDGAHIATPDDSTPIPPDLVFNNIIFRNRARVVADVPLQALDTVSLVSSSRLSHTRGWETGLVITSANVNVDTTSALDVSAKGYRGGQRDGYAFNTGETLTNLTGAQVRSGGSYGGRGGVFDGAGSNPAYGIPSEPVWLGSGGSSRGDSAAAGGNGGGRITIIATNSLIVNGTIAADGQTGNGFQAGSGSGGSVLLNVGTLTGSGVIRANGAAGEVAGGGGRVAVFYQALPFAVTNILATGGDASISDGGHGTVLLRSNIQTNGDLIVDGYGLATVSDSTPIPTNVVFDNIVFRNGARVQLVEPLIALGTIQIVSNAIVTHPLSLESGLRIEAANLFIGTNSAIDVSARGYRGGQRDGNALNEGLTTNETAGATVKSGGSYGGLGGAFGGTPNPTYGSPTNPVHLGSGGSSRGDSVAAGGNGGGRVTLVIGDTLTVNGTVRANGQNGNGFQAGSGSGGGIKIQTGTLAGDGTLEANGGGFEVGGGGGRIAVYLGTLAFNTNRATANGGIGAFASGANGSVYWGIPPAPPAFPPAPPIITGFGFVPPPLAPPPGAGPPPAPAPRIIWTAPDATTAALYRVQFSPTLTPPAWTTIDHLIHPAWTGTLPAGTDRGFLRIIQED